MNVLKSRLKKNTRTKVEFEPKVQEQTQDLQQGCERLFKSTANYFYLNYLLFVYIIFVTNINKPSGFRYKQVSVDVASADMLNCEH